MEPNEPGARLPRWFHRANWAGGALACFGIGGYPLVAFAPSIFSFAWALLWLLLGLGAANNAWLARNSIHVPSRFRRKKPTSGR